MKSLEPESYPEIGSQRERGDLLFLNDGPAAAKNNGGVDHQRVVAVQDIQELDVPEPSPFTASGAMGEPEVQPCERRPPSGVEESLSISAS